VTAAMIARHRRYFALAAGILIAAPLVVGVVAPDSPASVLKEGRRLAPAPGWPATAAGWLALPSAFDSWAKDHFGLRQALIQAQFLGFNRAQVGKVLPVLLEKPGRHAGQAVGKSPYLQSVHIDDAADQIGQIVNVRIRAAVGNSLAGDLILEPMSCPA